MKIAVISASRYGSAAEAGRWIADRLSLEGLDAVAKDVAEVDSIDEYDVVIIGSGIYSHKFLASANELIDKNLELLKTKKVALFALAMKREPIYVKGQVHGGLSHLQYLFDKLGDSVIHADLLPGEMAFARLNDKDKKGLEGFYAAIGLDEAEIAKRKQPRTLLSKKDFWEFAETVIQKIERAGG